MRNQCVNHNYKLNKKQQIMKKMLCGALMLLTAATAFVGCKKEDKKVIDTLTLSKTELTLAVGESQRLSVSANDNLTGTYSWASSDEEVATVDRNGTITAQNIGTATITVTETATKVEATCVVNVVRELETIQFSQASIGYYNKPDYLATLDTVDSVWYYTNDNKETIYLRGFLVDIDMDIFSDGFYINDNGEYDGASVGYMARLKGKNWYAPAGLNTDRGWATAIASSTGVWSTDRDETQSQSLVGGYLDNEAGAIEHVGAAIAYANEDKWDMYGQELGIADTMAFKGAKLWKFEYNSEIKGYATSWLPTAIVTGCALRIDYNENSNYMWTIPAIEMYMFPLGGDYGLGVEIESDDITGQMTMVSTEFIFEPVVHYKRIAAQAIMERAKGNQFDKHIRTFEPTNVIRK